MWALTLARAGVLLLSAIVLFLGMSGWLWLCAGFNRSGWRGVWGRVAVQVSAACLIYGLLRGRPLFGLFTAMFPPLFGVELLGLRRYPGFLTELAWSVAPYAGVVLLLCLLLRPLRTWSLGITSVSAMIVALFVGDQISQRAMCATAVKLGFDQFDRTTFAESLTHSRQELNFAVNAKAVVDGQTLGWTYSAMDWKVMSPRVAPNVAADAPFICPRAP
ncbi:MAG: hypothetical protein ACOH2H_16605 [Cypionkella sp.]